MCETSELYIKDPLTDPRKADVPEVPLLKNFEDIQKHYALIEVDCSQGWDITPPGQACWKLVGFHVTVGHVVITAMVHDKDGNYIRKKLVNFHYPSAPSHLTGNSPHLYFESGFSVETKWEGDGAQQAVYGSDVAPGKPGAFSVWVNTEPGQIGPNNEWIIGGEEGPKYSDAVKGLGWRGKTNHLIVSPDFRWVVKPKVGEIIENGGNEGNETETGGEVIIPTVDSTYLSIMVEGREIGRVKLD